METLLEHKKRADSVKLTLLYKTKWRDIPLNEKQFTNPCLKCGLPTVRIVNQNHECYTALCMSCHQAYRYHALSFKEAIAAYNDITQDDYDFMQIILGLDERHKKPIHNEFVSHSKVQCSKLVKRGYVSKEAQRRGFYLYQVTDEGLRFMGFDKAKKGNYLKINW